MANIFDRTVITDQAVDEAQKRSMVLLHEKREGVPVPGLHALYDVNIVHKKIIRENEEKVPA